MSIDLQISHEDILPMLESKNELFKQSVIAVFSKDERDFPDLVGTAFLVEYETEIYLVSARHVFDKYLSGQETKLYSRSGAEINFKKDDRLSESVEDYGIERDERDLFVHRLAGDHLKEFIEDSKLIPMEMRFLVPHDCPRNVGAFIATGYPASPNWAKKKMHKNEVALRQLCHLANSIDLKLYSKLGLDQKSHIAIDYPKKSVSGKQLPKPHGMSGGPLWRVEPFPVFKDGKLGPRVMFKFSVNGVLTDITGITENKKDRKPENILKARDISNAITMIHYLSMHPEKHCVLTHNIPE